MKYSIQGRALKGRWAQVHGYYDLDKADAERCIRLIMADMPPQWGTIYEYRVVASGAPA